MEKESLKRESIFDKRGFVLAIPWKMYNTRKHAYFDSCNVLQHLGCDIMNVTGRPGWTERVLQALQWDILQDGLEIGYHPD